MNKQVESRLGFQNRCSLSVMLATLVMISSASHAQSFTDFDDFLRQYAATDSAAQASLARSFVDWQQARGGFPIAESSGRVVFVYFTGGLEHDVRLTGDFRPKGISNPYWDVVGEPMTRVGSIFYLHRMFELDARLDYRFIVDGKRALDPLNPRKIVSGTGEGDASELVMPAHQIPAETSVNSGVPRGTLHVVQERWATPRVTIYLPVGYDAKQEYPTLYTADGRAWIDYIGLPTILDNMISAKAIEPIVAVLIDASADRSAWYDCNPEYLAYLKRVVAYVDDRYGTRARADGRVHAGTSAGGKASAYVGFEVPEVFGNVALLSPSVSASPSCFEPYFSGRKIPDRRLRVWMSAGTYEGAIHSEAESMAAFFSRVRVPVEASYVHQGHSFGAWRENAVGMLRFFFHHP